MGQRAGQQKQTHQLVFLAGQGLTWEHSRYEVAGVLGCSLGSKRVEESSVSWLFIVI